MPQIDIHNMDCLTAMREMPDKAFDLAIVDPPYGDDKIFTGGESDTKSSVRFHQLYSDNHKQWNIAPTPEYFYELMRVSKNQIIWGGNYFNLPPCRGFICWDKPQMRIHTMSNCEFAWTSFDRPAKIVPVSNYIPSRIHPSQKPVDLYKWLLGNYATQGDKILDTHLGSGSIAIAYWDLGYDLTAYETDGDYYAAAMTRIENHKAQLKLFK